MPKFEMSDHRNMSPLSIDERERYIELQKVVSEGMKDFVRVGRALREISERRLYRETHPTFETFLRDMYEIASSQGYRLIEASKVYELLSPNGGESSGDGNLSPIGGQVEDSTGPILPSNERQIRPLLKLDNPDKQREAWEKAVHLGLETTGKVSGSVVSAVVRGMKGEAAKAAVKKAAKTVEKDLRASQAFRSASSAFIKQIEIERANGWIETDRAAVIRQLESIKVAIEAE